MNKLTVNAGVVRLRAEAEGLRRLVPLEQEVEKPQVFLDGRVALGRRLERPSLLLHRVLYDQVNENTNEDNKKRKKREIKKEVEKRGQTNQRQ